MRAALRRPGLGFTVPVALAILAAGAIAVYAQQIWLGGGRYSRRAPRLATLEEFDGSFQYCRGFYESVRYEESGSGWGTDYPGADNNFSVRLAELTRVRVKLGADRQPHHVVVSLKDPMLFRCPILFMEDVGTIGLSDDEVENLRAYFRKGGFLWVDDFWGSNAWNQWSREIGRVLPPGQYPIFDIPRTHPIMSTLYYVQEVPQVAHIGFWRGSGGRTSERGGDSSEVHFRGIQDEHERLMVVMTHNTDIADTWEREGANADFFSLFSPNGYALGVNAMIYALTH
jgi:hypothetical protein